MGEDVKELRQAYERLFIAPFASHRWASGRGRSHWVDLEGWQNSIAGPLSSITSVGGCDYVYSREDDIFAGVTNPSRLRSRLLEWHAGLVAGIEQFKPNTPNEYDDLTFMRVVATEMRELVERACVAEQTRWDYKLCSGYHAELRTSVPPALWPTPSDEWQREAHRRSDEIDAGQMKTSPWTEVRSKSRNKAGLDD